MSGMIDIAKIRGSRKGQLRSMTIGIAIPPNAPSLTRRSIRPLPGRLLHSDVLMKLQARYQNRLEYGYAANDEGLAAN